MFHCYCYMQYGFFFGDIDNCRTGCALRKQGKDTTLNNTEPIAQNSKLY